MHRFSVAMLLVFSLSAAAQTPQQTPSPRAFVIRAARLIDGKSDVVQNDVAVVVEGDRIVAVGRHPRSPRDSPPAPVIDLGGATFRPPHRQSPYVLLQAT